MSADERVIRRGELAINKAKLLYDLAQAKRGYSPAPDECWTEFELLDDALVDLAAEVGLEYHPLGKP